MFWLGAIVSLCYVPGVTGAYIATQWPVLAIVLPFALLREGPYTAVHGLMVVFVAYAVMHLFDTPTPYASVFGAWLVVIMGLSLWFGTTLKNVRGLYAGLATGAAVSSGLAVLQYFGLGWPSAETILPAGLYVSSVQQGAVLALIVVALVSERMWIWALPLLPGIALSGSRGAFLMLAVGLAGCYVRRLWVFGLLAVAGAFYLLTPLSPSDQVRMLIWKMAWQNLTWFGWGPGVFYTILMPQPDVYIKHDGMFYPEYAHNDALQLVFEYGIGAILPAAVFAFVLRRTEAREWPVVLAFITAGCYSMPLFMPIASFLALVAVGRILRGYAGVRDDCDAGGRDVISRRRGDEVPGCEIVSMASRHPARG